jgi:Skp family chaperone for outer membrane proteins
MKRRQQGQVLPIGLALLALMLMGVFVLYNTGQVATDKLKLANAADAAAYSGSLWQARSMNFHAYTNRAMVANQVSMAQAVTLQSWSSYGAVAGRNISTVLRPVPVLNVVAQGVATGLASVERILSPIAGALLKVVDVVNRGLSVAQEAMFISTFVATPDVVRAVVSESDSRFSVNTAYSGIGISNNLNDWKNFTTRFTNEDIEAMQSRAGMINESRDTFTEQRNWKLFKNFWFYSTPLLRHRLYREGKTELILVDKEGEAQWEWKAKDTLSLHNRLWRWRGTKRYEIPIGWAEAFANSESANSTIEPGACSTAWEFQRSNRCARFLGMNRRAEYLADTGVRSPFVQQETRVAMSGFTGLRAFRSLSEQSIATDSPRIQLKIEVSLRADEVVSADSSGLGDTFKSPLAALGGVVSSISTAEVFYQRPDEGETTTLEKANAYSPYWGARLSPISASDRLLATSFRGSTGSVSAPGGLAGGASGLLRYQDDASAPANFETVIASRDTSSINRYQNVIQDELNAALANSIGQLLGGAVTSGNGGLFGDDTPSQADYHQYAENALAELSGADAAQPFQAAVQEAEQLALALENEFLRIRQQVSAEFEIAYAETRSDLDGEIAAIIDQVAQIRQYIEDHVLNHDSVIEQEYLIADLHSEAAELESGFNNLLATRLIEIVREATNLYVMPFHEALYTVEQWIRSDADEVSLPWTEVVDDD